MEIKLLTKWSAMFFLVLTANSVIAQTGSIKGRVSTSDGKPADGVTISLSLHGIGTMTNQHGNYELLKIQAGTYTVKISAIGLSSKSHQVTVFAGQVTNADFTLKEDSRHLQEIVISSPARKFAEKKSEYVARMPLKNLENSQMYTVVPKELFQEQMSVDLKSALQAVPGLSNITPGIGSGGIGLSIRLRGFSGTNAGGAIRNGMATNWVSMADPVNLESIEVIKGPSGTLFGGVLLSYGGLVNRVTKKPFNTTAGNINYSTGSFGLSRLTADVNTPLNTEKTLLFRVNAAYDKQKTFQDYGRSATRVFAPAFTYKVNDKLTLDLDFEYFKTERNTTYIGSIPTNGAVKAPGFDELNIDFKQSFTNNDLLSTAEIFNGFARASYKISAMWTSQTNYSYANTDNHANYLFLGLMTDSTLSRKIMNIPSTFGVNQLQQNFVGDMKLLGLRNRLLVCLDYTQITSNDRRTGSLAYDVVKLNAAAPDLSIEKYQQTLATAIRTTNNRNLETYSAAVSDVLNFTDQLMGMASVRVDRYSSKFEHYKQTAWSPKFGLVYQLFKDKVSLFGNYMNGFANVAPAAAYGYEGNYAFKPEQANQLEGGIKFELLGTKLNGTLSYYDIQVKDKLRKDQEHTDAVYYVQNGTQVSKGIDADLIANPLPGLHLIFGYGYNDSKYENADSSVTGLRPVCTPKHSANTWISYTIRSGKLSGIGLGIGGNYQSDSYFTNVRTNTSGTTVKYWTKAPYTFKIGSYTRFDATVFYDQPEYRLGFKMNNITNKEYWSSDAWASREPTRNFVVNLSYKF